MTGLKVTSYWRWLQREMKKEEPTPDDGLRYLAFLFFAFFGGFGMVLFGPAIVLGTGLGVWGIPIPLISAYIVGMTIMYIVFHREQEILGDDYVDSQGKLRSA